MNATNTVTNRGFSMLPPAEHVPERVALLYRLSGNDIPAIVIAAAVAAFALVGYASPRLIVAWLGWIALACVVRVLMARLYRRSSPPPEDALQWESAYCGVAALVGTSWGLSSLLFFTGSSQIHELLLTSLIGSMAMGLPASLAPSPKAFACFITPVLAPLIGVLFSQGGGFNASAALLILVFSAGLLGLYLSSNRALQETLRMGAENAKLLDKLTIAERSVRAALAEQQLIFDTTSIGLAVVKDGTVQKCNRAFANLLGYSGDDMAGQSTRVWYEDSATWEAVGNAALAAYARGEVYTHERKLRRKNGSNFWALLEGCPFDASSPQMGAIVALNDISARKRAESELHVALQREKELSEMKSKFVSTASHEFRTPLATILSSAELLEHYAENLSVEEKLDLLRGIQGGTKRMSALLDDILTVGKAESGILKLNLSPLDLKLLCKQVVNDLHIGEAKHHILNFENHFPLDSVVMDEKLLRHILNNLLSNAAKYSPSGSEIRLTLSQRDGAAVIEVTDHGIGIPVQDHARMFESFQRASNVDNRPGTGLGLAIMKKSVELHGGQIRFESVVDRGTTFTVTLPLNLAASDASVERG